MMKRILTMAVGFLVVAAITPTAIVQGTDGTLPFAVQAPFQTIAPVRDGDINVGEYAFKLPVSFAGGTNPGEVHPDFNTGWNNTDADLSLNLYLGHDVNNLYIGFEVTDDFIDTNPLSTTFCEGWPFRAYNNDSIEIAINGDGANNDAFDPQIPDEPNVAPELGVNDGEAFFYVVDAANQVYNTPNPYECQNKVGDVLADGGPLAAIETEAKITATGYNIEFVIPLATIDTLDGPGRVAATTGDTLKFDFSVTDNDAAVLDAQDAFLMFWNSDNLSPSQSGEPSWEVDLELTAALGQDGDFDGDTDVDGADFLKWQRELGDADSLALWEANYGTTAATAATGAVPEPTTAVLLGVWMLTLAMGRAPRSLILSRDCESVGQLQGP